MSTIVVGEDTVIFAALGEAFAKAAEHRRGGDDGHRLECLPDPD